MMKKLHKFLMCLCIFGLLEYRASAQIIFTGPTSSSTEDLTIDGIKVNSSGTVSPTPRTGIPFVITVYRRTTYINDGFVEIYAGDNSGNLGTNPLTLTGTRPNTASNQWGNAGNDAQGNAYQYQTLRGTFDIGSNSIGANTKLYAVASISTNPPSRTAQSAGISFTVSGPVLTSITPNKGRTNSQVSLGLTGNTLNGTSQVLFGSQPITPSAVYATQVTTNFFTLPNTSGQFPVKVVTPNGTSNSIPFDVIAPSTTPPNITTLSPTSGPVGTTVTITGSTDWLAYDNIQVYFGSTAATTVNSNGTSIITTIPNSLPIGRVPVVVYTSVGNSNTLYFDVVNPSLINITLVPTSGPAGSSFAVHTSRQIPNNANYTYNFDGIPLSSTSYSLTDSQGNTYYSAQIKAPNGTSLGAKKVVITDPNGKAYTNDAYFTITQNQPPANVLSLSFGNYVGLGPNPGDKIVIQTDLDWEYYIKAGYGPPRVNFTNASTSNISYSYLSQGVGFYANGEISVIIPPNARDGLVTITNDFGTGKGVNIIIGETQYLPCSSSSPVTCFNQCVSYGVQPKLLQGRILADDGDKKFQAYLTYCSYRNISAFAQGNEYEWAQWQISYDGNNWSDINGATNADYQPNACYQITYYRRVSTHKEYHTFGSSREYWYTSEVITITPQAPTPTPARTNYSSCGNSQITVNVIPNQSSQSYNWASADPNWSINGQTGSVLNVGASVQLTPPVNVAPGTYTFYVSANSICGSKSSDATVTVTISAGSNPVTAPSGARLVKNGTGCGAYYNISLPAIPNATTYEATFDGNTIQASPNASGNVVFTFGFATSGGSYQTQGSITVTGTCNSASTSYTFNIPGGGGRCNVVADSPASLTAFPNPASDQMVMRTGGVEAVATFYDSQGTLRKTINLKARIDQTDVSVRDLPAGIYYLRIVNNGKEILQKQIKIDR